MLVTNGPYVNQPQQGLGAAQMPKHFNPLTATQATECVRQPAIPAVLQEIDGQLDLLEKEWSRCVQKIQPVLRSSPEVPPKPECAVESDVPLVQKLNSFYSRIASIRQNISYVINTIEL